VIISLLSRAECLSSRLSRVFDSSIVLERIPFVKPTSISSFHFPNANRFGLNLSNRFRSISRLFYNLASILSTLSTLSGAEIVQRKRFLMSLHSLSRQPRRNQTVTFVQTDLNRFRDWNLNRIRQWNTGTDLICHLIDYIFDNALTGSDQTSYVGAKTEDSHASRNWCC